MNKIVVLGAGVMGSALCVPAADNTDNEVTLVGTPLDESIISALASSRHHPTLDAPLPERIQTLPISQLDPTLLQSADIIVLGVSSAGIHWACDVLNKYQARPSLLALVTKGLVSGQQDSDVPLTYADALQASMTNPAGNIVGIGGPCIARELALRYPTRVTFASRDLENSQRLRDIMQTGYYRISTDQDIVAVEACAALKNFLCIGVSAMLTAHRLGDSHAKNPLAALFSQAVRELMILSRWINGSSNKQSAENDMAFDLAGMGDLHVTVGGGRNSRLGASLGSGRRLDDLLQHELKGVTVEGVDTGRQLSTAVHAACKSNALDASEIPLTLAILDAIMNNAQFNFDFGTLPTQGSDHES